MKNLPDNLTSEQLKQAFEKYGPVTSATVRQGYNSGYVCYADAESARKAVYEATLQSPFPESGQVDVDYFTPKERRDDQAKEVYETSLQNQMHKFMTMMSANPVLMSQMMPGLGPMPQRGNFRGHRGGHHRGGHRGGRGRGHHHHHRGGYNQGYNQGYGHGHYQQQPYEQNPAPQPMQQPAPQF